MTQKEVTKRQNIEHGADYVIVAIIRTTLTTRITEAEVSASVIDGISLRIFFKIWGEDRPLNIPSKGKIITEITLLKIAFGFLDWIKIRTNGMFKSCSISESPYLSQIGLDVSIIQHL